MVSLSLCRSQRVDSTHLPTRGIDFKRLSRQQEIELNASAFLVAHTREQSSILKVYQSNRNRSQVIQRREKETTALTGKIHNVMVEFDLGPVFEHGLERGTGTFRSFHLRDRHDFVWVHDGIGTLRKRIENKKGGMRVVCPHVTYRICDVSQTSALEVSRQTPIIPEFRAFSVLFWRSLISLEFYECSLHERKHLLRDH